MEDSRKTWNVGKQKTGNGGQQENLEWRTAGKLRMEDSRKTGTEGKLLKEVNRKLLFV